jgi:hypothetical protein
MPIVPTNKLIPDNSTRPDEQSLLMAAAIMKDLGRFDDLEEPGMSRNMKDFIERKRDIQDNPYSKTPPAKEIRPGEQIEDPQRGPTPSERDVRRI